MRWKMVRAVIRVDLFKLVKSRDYWIPLIILGGMFFVVMPVMLLGAMSLVQDTGAVAQIGQIIGTLPAAIQENIQGDNGATRASYAFAVYLLAPIAIIVPLTISSAVGSNSIVGEREQGTGEFLAHSPLTVKEIYVGKLIASLIPGYVAGIVGFGLYSIVVNVIVGSQLGGWFFPTAGWLILVLWVVPPFIAIALSLILRLSARVRDQARPSGVESRDTACHRHELRGGIRLALQPSHIGGDCWTGRLDHRSSATCFGGQVNSQGTTSWGIRRPLARSVHLSGLCYSLLGPPRLLASTDRSFPLELSQRHDHSTDPPKSHDGKAVPVKLRTR
jgi:ABC-2 type transport system permease protein